MTGVQRLPHDPAALDTLHPAQRAAARQARLPRRRLGRGTLALLVALRVYVLLAIPVVGYAFVRALVASH